MDPNVAGPGSDGGQEWGKWTLEKLWENREWALARLRDLYSWFRGSGSGPAPARPGILILGPGGAGKTTLGKMLSGQYNLLLDLPGHYDESIDTEKFTLSDDEGVEVVVPPGQEHRKGATWADLHAGIAAGKYRGVILLSSYGYHSFSISYKMHRLYDRNKANFLQAYLENRRAYELTVLRELLPHMQVSPGKLWLLSLVTKRDLWYPSRAEVEPHYRGGDYAAEVEKLKASKGERLFRHEFAFTSLVISNFMAAPGEKLKPNAEGYDHQLHAESIRRLFETLEALRKWEGEP